MSRPKTKTKPRAPRFDMEALRDLAGDKVFARGVAYHEDKQVEIIAVERKRVLARVAGSEIYKVELLGAGSSFSGQCSCPAFSDHGFCKHMVATALSANAMEPGEAKQAGNRFARIRDNLRAQGVDALVSRIMELAERDPALFEELEFAAELDDADDEGALGSAFGKAITDCHPHARLCRIPSGTRLGERASIVSSTASRISSTVARRRLCLRCLIIFSSGWKKR